MDQREHDSTTSSKDAIVDLTMRSSAEARKQEGFDRVGYSVDDRHWELLLCRQVSLRPNVLLNFFLILIEELIIA